MIQLSRVLIVDVRSNMLLASLFVCKRQEACQAIPGEVVTGHQGYAPASLKNPCNCVLKRVSRD
jgi:hypothetical protein